jgi:pilus assembly protein CpaB
MAKISGKALLGVALVLSLITSALVYNYLKGLTVRTIKPGQPVIIAKADIPARTQVTPDMIQVSQVPEEYMQPGALSDRKMVVGIMTREKIIAGEQITERRLAIEGKTAGFTGLIPKDKRAITVAVTEVTGVAGFIKPGDYVDVIGTFDQNVAGEHVSHILLQNLLVLAFNHESEMGSELTGKDKKDPSKSMTVTLAATPDEAAKITLTEEKGRVRLALRPHLPQNNFVIAAAVTPKDIVGDHSPAPKPSSPPPGPPGENGRLQPAAEGKGIITIRGTKMETIPVN